MNVSTKKLKKELRRSLIDLIKHLDDDHILSLVEMIDNGEIFRDTVDYFVSLPYETL